MTFFCGASQVVSIVSASLVLILLLFLGSSLVSA